mmetsp:Transcript_21576/g.38161  ORF Transcript_21576/g.38161 Transcript_21576/m.38161 type:complete len:191 (+) Transcript_21576:2436-3008(+)
MCDAIIVVGLVASEDADTLDFFLLLLLLLLELLLRALALGAAEGTLHALEQLELRRPPRSVRLLWSAACLFSRRSCTSAKALAASSSRCAEHGIPCRPCPPPSCRLCSCSCSRSFSIVLFVPRVPDVQSLTVPRSLLPLCSIKTRNQPTNKTDRPLTLSCRYSSSSRGRAERQRPERFDASSGVSSSLWM